MEQGELLFGVSYAEIMEWCGVDRTTANRWKRHQARAPQSALRLVALRASGDAGAILGTAWCGWIIGKDSLIYAPGHRKGFSPGEILTLPYLYAALAFHRRRSADATPTANPLALMASR